MIKTQYASIPIEYLEMVKSSSNEKIVRNVKLIYKLKLSKYNPYNKYKMSSIVVRIKLDKRPYIEELLTQNKIGLNKEDGFKIYLKGDAVYNLCSKEEAYIKAASQINYHKEVLNLFES